MVSNTLLKIYIIFNISTSRVELTTYDSRTLHTPDLVIHSASNTTANIPTNEKSTATRVGGGALQVHIFLLEFRILHQVKQHTLSKQRYLQSYKPKLSEGNPQ